MSGMPNCNPVPKIAGYEIHPLALAFPPSADEEAKALTEDIRKNGLLRPVTIHEGKILDGRNRAAACEIAGVKLRTELLPEGISPIDFVVAQNLRRRQFSPTQRAVTATKLLPHYRVEAAARKRVLSGTRSNPDGSEPEVAEKLPEPEEQGEAREKAAMATGANPRYVSDLLRLQRMAPELFDDVEAGRLSIAKALKELESREDEAIEKQRESKRTAFIVVLWDDLESGVKPGRAPEKSYNSKVYPNVAFFRLHRPGVCDFGSCRRYGMTQVAWFAVSIEQGQPILDRKGTPLAKATCSFLTLSVRGDVPKPEVLPDQIVGNGYAGLIGMINSMWPKAMKVVSTTRSEAPTGWEFIAREFVQENSLSTMERPPAQESSKAVAPLQGASKLKKGKQNKGSTAKPQPPASKAKDIDGPPLQSGLHALAGPQRLVGHPPPEPPPLLPGKPKAAAPAKQGTKLKRDINITPEALS